MADAPSDEEAYRPEEVARRRDELARRMLNLPPQPPQLLKSKTNPKNRVSVASNASPKKRERPKKTNQT